MSRAQFTVLLPKSRSERLWLGRCVPDPDMDHDAVLEEMAFAKDSNTGGGGND